MALSERNLVSPPAMSTEGHPAKFDALAQAPLHSPSVIGFRNAMRIARHWSNGCAAMAGVGRRGARETFPAGPTLLCLNLRRTYFRVEFGLVMIARQP